MGRSTGRSTPWYWYLVVKNGNFTLLLLEPILADQVPDLLAHLPPPVLASSGQECDFTLLLLELILGDLPVYLNCNFRFLLLELIWADQLADLPLCENV